MNGGTVTYTFEADTSKFLTDLEEVSKEFDRLTDKLADVKVNAKTSKEISDTVENIIHLQQRLANTTEGTEEYDSALIQCNEQLDYFRQLLGETGEAAKEASTPLQSFGQAVADIASKAGLAALKGVATGATTALVALAQKGIAATDFLETSQIGMAGLLGSMSEGTKALSVAADFWQNNPFNRFDVTNATKQLVQYGRTTSQLAKDLEILGKVSLSTGVGIDELALRYGRVSSSGRAMTLDIEMMANRGVPIYRELQRIMGATSDEVRKLASEGKISFEIFKEAMEGAVDSEAMAAYEQTLARQRDRLSGSISILAGDLAGYKIVNNELQISADGLYKTWTNLINTLATGLRTSSLREGLEKIGKALASVLDGIFKFYTVWDEANQKLVTHSATLEKVFNALGKVVNFLGDNSELLIPIAITALGVVTRLISQVPILGSAVSGLNGVFTRLGGLVGSLAKQRPLLLGFIAFFTVGLVQAYKNSAEFRKSVGTLFSSLTTIVQKLLPVITALVDVFVTLASSETVTGILRLLVGTLASLASVIASIPEEALMTMVGAILALKISSVSPWLAFGAALASILAIVKKSLDSFGGLTTVVKNTIQGLVDFFTGIDRALWQAGGDFVGGFLKGFMSAWLQVRTGVIGAFSGLVDSVKNLLGIHSPSVVMEGIGQNVGLGLAKGIQESSSVVEKAMNSLATDVLKAAEKTIGNMSDFGVIDANGVYKQWKKVANIFTIGSEQYASAIEKMEQARKSVNLQILSLQNEYNSKLDETIKKIQTAYGLFDDVSETTKKTSGSILKGLDKQVAKTKQWAEAQRQIKQLDIAEGLKEELREMGVGSASELSEIANMTTSELENLNSLWLEKQELATESATDQLADYRSDVLDQVKKLSDGIDGETIVLRELGGRLVSSIGEGITGALPTLDNSLSKLNDYIAEAASQLASTTQSASGVPETEPEDNDDPFGIKKALESLGLSENGGKLGWLALGLGGGAIASKVLKNFGAFDKLASKGGVLGGIGKLFGGKATTTVASSAANVSNLSNLSGISDSASQISKTSSSLSKANEWMTTITKGAIAIAAIAVAVAAIAGAIWVMDNALAGIDWGTFISKLGMVVVTTIAMGALATAMGQIIKTVGGAEIALGIVAIIGLAIDIAAMGLAVGAMARAIPDDLGGVQVKLLLVYEAVVVMGVLATAIGLVLSTGIGALMVAGLAVIIGLAVDVAAMGVAIGFMARAIPDDLGMMQNKLLLVYEAVAAFEVLAGVAGILAVVEGLGILVIKGIADEIREVAVALAIMYYAIPDDLAGVQTKLDYVKEAIVQMGEANFGNLIGNLINKKRLEQVAPIALMFRDIGVALSEIGEIGNAGDKIDSIVYALQKMIEGGANLDAYYEMGAKLAKALASGVIDQQNQLIVAAESVQNAFWVAVENKKNDEYQQGRSLGEVFRQGLYDVDYANAGWWAIQGFINGANNRAYASDGVYHNGWWIADNFLKGLSDRGEQGSPWRTTMKSGRWAVEGLIEGMESMESQVLNEAETLADGIVNALDLSGTTVSPNLSVGSLSPSVGYGEEANGYGSRAGSSVIIEQTNNVYSELDMEVINRNMAWELAKA